jgi:hypothetical protein
VAWLCQNLEITNVERRLTQANPGVRANRVRARSKVHSRHDGSVPRTSSDIHTPFAKISRKTCTGTIVVIAMRM